MGNKINGPVEAGRAKQKVCGLGQDSIVGLLRFADMLWHDTLKGAAELQSDELCKKGNEFFEKSMEVAKKHKSVSVISLKKIALWVGYLADCFEEIERQESQVDVIKNEVQFVESMNELESS